MRKTVRLAKLVEDANLYLATSTGSPESRHHLHGFIEVQLMAAKCYRGFGYINGWPCDDDSRTFFYSPP